MPHHFINMPDHYDTPRRARVQGVYKYLTTHDIPFEQRDIFKQFNVSMNVGYTLIQKDAPSRRNRRRMGRPYKLLRSKCSRQIRYCKTMIRG